MVIQIFRHWEGLEGADGGDSCTEPFREECKRMTIFEMDIMILGIMKN